MHGANVSTRWMRDQNRHAIRRSRSDTEALGARDEHVAFHVGNLFDDI